MKRDLLTALQEILGPWSSKDDKGNYVFMCPNCNHPKPHLVIHIEQQYYHCWVCEFKGKGIKYMLKKLGFEGESRLFEWDGIKSNLRTLEGLEAYIKGYTPKNSADIILPDGYVRLYKRRRDLMFMHGYNYLIRRNILDDQILKYDIHYSPKERRILIPSYDMSFKLNYYLTRAVDDEVKLKYKNASAVKRDIVFNEFMVDWSKTIILVEGVFDAMTVGSAAIPILGSTINEDFKIFKNIIKYKSNVVLCFDPDAEVKQMKVGSIFRKHGIDVSYIDMQEYNEDIAELGSEKFKTLMINNIRKHDLKQSVLAKLM